MTSQAAASEGPISAPSGRVSGAPLIGNVGQEYVQTTLSTNDPVTAINDIQTRVNIQDARCRPLLGLLDQIGLTRAESHKHIVDQAVQKLLERIPALPAERLLSLLEETFPYITIPDLRAVPLAVLDRLRPVPATFLKQLAADREIFWELPLGVQRQAWEFDKKLLRGHALSLLTAYTYETATWVQTLNMDEAVDIGGGGDARAGQLDGVEGGGTASGAAAVGRKVPQLARKNLRNGSSALRRLVAMVGPSPTVYRGIVDLCTARFRESESTFMTMNDAALCVLRSQLLMAMHDAGETTITLQDSCHKLAWTLDVCLKDGKFVPKQLKELRSFFGTFAAAANARRKNSSSRRTSARGSRGQRYGSSDVDEDAESAGVPGAAAVAEDPLKELGAAGMVLRDPATFHLMLHEVVRHLERCVANQAVPKDDLDLDFLTQLLTLAVSVRSMLRTGEYDFPEADVKILETLYPLLSELILDAELMEVDDEAGEDQAAPPPPPTLVPLMVEGEIARRVVQTYALKRLAVGDLITGQRVLVAIEQSLGYLSLAAIPEFSPFAFTLARRIASLLADGKVSPSSPLWKIAVEGILLRLVDSETEAHEEVLRLILAAAPSLDPLTLGKYLATTLSNSVRSRREHQARSAEEAGLPPLGYGQDSGWEGGMYSAGSAGADMYHDWQYGGAGGGEEERGADGVRGTYALFLSKQPALTQSVAPELFTYLESNTMDD